jgi:cytochrome c-type biogenesis protein CcsB
MRSIWIVTAALLTTIVTGFAAEQPANVGVEQAKEFFRAVELPPALDDFAVKGTVVQLFSTYADRHITALRGRGNPADSDLLPDNTHTVLAILTDANYRENARVLYVDKNVRLGIPKGRFLSLGEFRSTLMPQLNRIMSSDDHALMRPAMELANRAEILAGLGWENLLIFPPAQGLKWNTTAEQGAEAQSKLAALQSAYAARDAKGYTTALGEMVTLANATNPQNSLPGFNRSLERFTATFDPTTVAFWVILLATLVYFVVVALGVRPLRLPAFILSVLGTILLLIALIIRTVLAGHLPVTSLYEYLSLTALTVMIAFIVFYGIWWLPLLGALANPVALLLMVTASLFPSEIEAQLIPALQSFWLEIHVTLAALGEGAFAVAAVCSAMYLALRKAKPNPKGNLPNVELLDKIAYRAMAVGYPLFTIGALVAGAIWAEIAWGAWWSWDPKETGAFVVWVLASLYLHARLSRGWKGKRTAILAILVFVFAILTLLANTILGGLHSYGTG